MTRISSVPLIVTLLAIQHVEVKISITCHQEEASDCGSSGKLTLRQKKKDMAAEFGIPPSILSAILKNRESL